MYVLVGHLPIQSTDFHVKFDLEVLSEIPPALLFEESECGRLFCDELL